MNAADTADTAGAAGGMVVVGAGECGTRTAFALREAGWSGPVTLVGAEPVLPYERPQLSKSALLAPSPAPTPLCDAGTLRTAGITLLAGAEAVALDAAAHRVHLGDGRVLGYERLLLATGARARTLPSSGVAVHTLRSLTDAATLRPRLTPGTRIGIVGGGFIGLELAATANSLGCTVTVLEQAPQLMARAVPPRVAAVVAARHHEAGVDVRCGTGVTGLTPASSSSTTLITLTDGGCVEVDVVVAGVGSAPRTDLAEAVGLVVDDGVRVDARLATSAPDVFAAGDCCSFPHPLYDGHRLRLESWRAAREQAEVAARNMLGGREEYGGVPWFWSDQYDLTLQVAGLPGAACEEVVRVRPDGVELCFGLAPDGRLVSAAAAGPGNAVARDVRLADMLIARRATPSAAQLADNAIHLKTLFRETGERVRTP